MWVVLQHLTIYKCATEEHFPCALCCPEGKAHLLVVFTVLMQVSSWCAAVGLAGISSWGSEQKKGWCFQWGCCVLWQPQFLSYLEQCKWRTCAACLKVPWKHRSVWKWAAFFLHPMPEIFVCFGMKEQLFSSEERAGRADACKLQPSDKRQASGMGSANSRAVCRGEIFQGYQL